MFTHRCWSRVLADATTRFRPVGVSQTWRTTRVTAAARRSGSRQGSRRHNHGYPPPSGDRETISSKMWDSAATSFAQIVVLGGGFALAGYIYHKSYKQMVLAKMANAFEPGDPVLDLAAIGRDVPAKDPNGHWVDRPEQHKVDSIIAGVETGHYHLLIGEKGTGKSSMLLESMRKIDGKGVAIFEAHSDLEIFRIRLGKALDYEFHEDYIGGYFSERGPRDTTALLDIERALNKLEKVALRHRSAQAEVAKKIPLVLIINGMHLIRDNDDGRDLLELLQQRAEMWAATNLVTMVFNSDDYWIYERFKQLATRMEVTSVGDLQKEQAISALQKYRLRYFQERVPYDNLERVYDLVGGRLTFLNQVAKSKNMIKTCDEIKEVEKQWFLNQCWILGPEMDDDVMDQQKWASAAMVLAQALVDEEGEMESTYDSNTGHLLPAFKLHEAQQVMTRSDFIRELDRLNIFAITSDAKVRASSVPMHLAFKEICDFPNFRKHLDGTLVRIGDIESLERTRELVAKDLVLGGKYSIKTLEGGQGVEVSLKQVGEDGKDQGEK